MQRRIDMVGQRFGRLTVVRITSHIGKSTAWWCRCDCGNEKAVRTLQLTAGKTKSCGCYRVDLGKVNGAVRQLRHGEGGNGNETPEYRAWSQAKSRCHNPGHSVFASYGGRGIVMCERWRNSYEAFLEDMGRRPGPKHSLDRIDNERGYEPGNCRWSTLSEQNSNRRPKIGPVRFVQIGDENYPLGYWLQRTNTPRRTFYERLKRGMAIEEALGLHVAPTESE